MSGLQRYAAGAMLRGPSRQTIRTLARIDEQTEITTAVVQARAEVQAAQVDALSAVTQRALQGAAFISQVEQSLGQAVPLAVSRLQAIGDIGTIGLTEIVMDTANKLRRV